MELRSERLLLRPFADADAPALHRQWNEPDVRRYLFDDAPVARDAVVEQIAASRRGFVERGCGFFTLRPRERPSEVIGFAGLRPYGEPARIELLYALAPEVWGRGLATEASQAVLDLGFRGLGLEAIDAGADLPNAASFEVMARLRMPFLRDVLIGGRAARYHSLDRRTFESATALEAGPLLRPALSKEDLSEIRALIERYVAWIGIDLSFQGFAAELRGLPGDYAPPDGVLVLARVGGRAAGCVGVRRFGEDAAEMKRLYVADGFRGRRLGSDLAGYACDFARAAGLRRVLLDTLPMMGEAQRLYERMGFRDTTPYRPNPVAGARFLELRLG